MTNGTRDDLWGLLFKKTHIIIGGIRVQFLTSLLIPGDVSVNGLSNGFLVPDPLLLGLQQPPPRQTFPMVLSSKLSW